MSMLSSKCDRLRDRAHELRMFADGLSAPYIVPSTKETMGLSMRSAATELERAADTIWSLRNKLADVVDQREEVERLQDENAKLRKLVRELKHHVCRLRPDEPCAVACDGYDDMLNICYYETRMKELGIEP